MGAISFSKLMRFTCDAGWGCAPPDCAVIVNGPMAATNMAAAAKIIAVRFMWVPHYDTGYRNPGWYGRPLPWPLGRRRLPDPWACVVADWRTAAGSVPLFCAATIAGI